MNAVDLVSLNTRGESCFRESHYAKPWCLNVRTGRFSVKCNPDFGRALRANVVETERRQKTYDAARYLLCYLRERKVAGDSHVWKHVDTAAHSNQQASLIESP